VKVFYHFNQAKPVPMTSDSAAPKATPIQKLGDSLRMNFQSSRDDNQSQW